MILNRTGSLWDRLNRNGINENWATLEGSYKSLQDIEKFLEGFDGTQFIKKGRNLFNKDSITIGEIDRGTGDVVTDKGSYAVTDYIPVVPGIPLQVKPTSGWVSVYDINYNFLEMIASATEPKILPSNAAYIRNQMSLPSVDAKYIYQSNDPTLPYDEYGWSFMPEFLEMLRESIIGDDSEYINLFDKTKVVVGGLDSSTGALIDGDYRVSEFIEVIPGKRLQVKPTSGWITVYDADYNFIESIASATEPKMLPSKAKYVRNQMSTPSVEGKYIYMGEEDMPYFPYGEGPFTSGGTTSQKEIKILGLGNSYSNDTFWMLKDIAESAGYKVTVGISHLSGGTLNQVYDAINSNGTVTTYNKFTSSGLNARTNFNAKDIITDEEWDYIFIQQASTSAMDYATYQPALGNLVSYLKANATNPSVKLGINMPWVRPISHSTIGTAEKQLQVNAAIIDACQQAMFDENLDVFIPTGIAIMNGRSNDYLAQVSDELTKDGSHLDEGIGRYLAALTAFNAIFGEVADGNITYSPIGANNFHSYLSKISAKKAVIEPFEVTKV